MRERRDRVRERLPEVGADALLVGHRPNVRYLTGFSGSYGQILVGAEDVLLTDSRYEEQSAREVADLHRVIQRQGGRLVPLIAEAIVGLGVRRVAVEAQHVSMATGRALAEAMPDVTLVETSGVVEALRRVKDEGEITMLAVAASFADRALEALLGGLAEAQSEREVAAVLEDAMRRAGSDGPSFDTIVAFGENAAEPHHRPGDRTLRRGDLVKLDFGATHAGYHSDMTRTVAFGRPDPEAARIYDLVRRAQRAGVEAVGVGVGAADVDAAARAPLLEAGYDFGHSTGHGIGLEVHEEPSLRKESADILAAGMAVTVEPGVYLPGVGGVRIEDTVIVRDGGCDIVTKFPKDLIVV